MPVALQTPREAAADSFDLVGPDGTTLLLVQLTLPPDRLEEVLSQLALLSFPVNPEVLQRASELSVEFPAYSSSLAELAAALPQIGWNGLRLSAGPMMEAVRPPTEGSDPFTAEGTGPFTAEGSELSSDLSAQATLPALCPANPSADAAPAPQARPTGEKLAAEQLALLWRQLRSE